jgi:Helix-turn-helix domain
MLSETNPPLEDNFGPEKAAKYLGLAKQTLAKCRCRGGGPAYLKLGRKVVYRRLDLEEWLSTRRARSTSDAARLPHRLAGVPIDA